MNVDTFTLSALAVVLFVIVVLGWALSRARKADRASIEQLRNQLDGVSGAAPTAAARELCRAIRCLYPSAQSGVDFNVADGTDGAFISEWELPVPQPDDASLQQAMIDCRKASETGRYREERALAYPPVNEQLDALYQARTGDSTALDDIDRRIAEVRSRYPNPDDPC